MADRPQNISGCSITIVILLTSLLVNTPVQQLFGQVNPEIHRLSKNDILPDDNTIFLSDVWLFETGDDPQWAHPSFADTTWKQVSTYLGPSELPFLDWNGIGWFRIHLKVDSSLVNYPLGIVVEQHNGASEIFHNGEKISQIGEVSASVSAYKPERFFDVIPIVFSDTTEQVLAVRYSNHEASYFNSFNDLGFTSGFRFLLGDLKFTPETQQADETPYLGMPVFFIGILLAFTTIHFLLYLFYPANRRNLYYALFTGVLVLLIYALYINEVTESPLKALFYYRFSLICWLLTMVFALRFTYSLLYKKVPLQFWLFLVIAGAIAAISWFTDIDLVMVRELFVVLTLVEILRVLVFSFFRDKSGIWIVAAGVLFFVGGIFYKILVDLDMVTGQPVSGSMYGSGALIFAMSIYLSRDFAKTNRRLEHKLREVKHLSERALAQERINREKEIERKLLSAENERKSRELEEARRLQLSMLPKKIPGNKCWDIAVFMETAQEVGGDYYDFSDSEHGELTIALGDATGHGMKAGIMVAAAKSYFHTLADEPDLLEVLNQMSAGIRNMDLKTMFMGFQLLKCSDYSVTFTSAGMPPALWYKKGSAAVEEVLIKGLPLGTRARFPYRKMEFSIEPGDALVLMSDGLTELFNSDREQLGKERIRQTLQEFGTCSASDILSQITRLVDQWSGGKDQEDDITVMVLKAK